MFIYLTFGVLLSLSLYTIYRNQKNAVQNQKDWDELYTARNAAVNEYNSLQNKLSTANSKLNTTRGELAEATQPHSCPVCGVKIVLTEVN